jgi:glycosyltransferase involved in cell wall biosynthesis
LPRLLVVADTLAGGLGAAALAHVEWFRAHGWEAAVAAPRSTRGAIEGFRPVAIPSSARRLSGVRAAGRELRAVATELRPDVIHCHGARALLVARAAGLRADLTLHGAGSVPGERLLYRGVRAATRRVLPALAAKAYAATPELGSAWTFLPHASPLLDGLEPLPFPDGGTPTFLWLGRLEPPKRPDLFVRAIAAASQRVPVRGLVAGGGSLETELRAVVADTSAPVELVGRSEDVESLLREAWAVVLLSGFEAVAFSVQEAMWAGRSVVVSPLPGLRWLVGDAGRTAVDETEAVDAIVDLADITRARELGRRAAERVRSLIAPDAPWPELAERYESRRKGSAARSGRGSE